MNKKIESSDWLTRGYSEAELANIKEQALKEAEAELRNKQIEEMAIDLRKSEFWYFDDTDCDFELDRKNTAKNLYTAGYRKPEWISVEERLPDQDGKYLAYTRRGFTVLSYYYALEGAFGFEHWDVTHWMPLPEAPKGDEGNENRKSN